MTADALGSPTQSPPETAEARAVDLRTLDGLLALADALGCRPGATGPEVLERARATRAALERCHAVLEAQVTCVVCECDLHPPERVPRCCSPRDEAAEERVNEYEHTSARRHEEALDAAWRVLTTPEAPAAP